MPPQKTFDVNLTEAVSLLAMTLSLRKTGRGAGSNVPPNKHGHFS